MEKICKAYELRIMKPTKKRHTLDDIIDYCYCLIPDDQVEATFRLLQYNINLGAWLGWSSDAIFINFFNNVGEIGIQRLVFNIEKFPMKSKIEAEAILFADRPEQNLEVE